MRPAVTSDPIFIVGLPRSGTTLMAVCLDRHPAIHCGPETHLLARLATSAGRGVVDPATWPDVAVEFLCHPSTDEPWADPVPQDPARIREFLATRPPSAAAMLEALVALPAADVGKRRWAEKTPRHLDFLGPIRAAWPDAAIVHLVRDPRSRAVSMSRVPFGPGSQIANLLDGIRRERRAGSAVDADPKLLTIRLEDLQVDPEATLRRVCAFLGETYDPAMLTPSEGAPAVPDGEWWKRSATGPVSATGQSSWQQEMPQDVQRFASLYCARQLERHGYPGARAPRSTVVVVPMGSGIIEDHESVALALAAQDVVIGGLGRVTWRRLRRARTLVYWGSRGRLSPRVHGRPVGWMGILALGADLVLRRLRRRPAAWVEVAPTEDASSRTARGAASSARERILALGLRLFARRLTPDELVLREAQSDDIRAG